MVLAKERYRLRGRDMAALDARFIPFTAQTRMSGVDVDGRVIRKGAADAVDAHVAEAGRSGAARAAARLVERSPRRGGTPLAVAEDGARARRRSTSRTSSRAASASASPSCGGWASGR